MRDLFSRTIGEEVIKVYEGHDASADALRWLREKPRTFGELREEDIDWLRWMAASIQNQELLEQLSQDSDADVRMWVACNPMTSETVLRRLAEDSVVFVRRAVARNHSAPVHLLIRLNQDSDIWVRVLAYRDRRQLETAEPEP